MKTMKTGLFAAVIAIVALVFAGIAAAEEVGTKSKEGIGNYLADSRGMTLYSFDKDSPGKSACVGPCVENWPIFYAEKVTVSAGLDAKNFGTITREDGKKQSTYKDAPLYYFSKDSAPGDTNGQGFKNIWRAAKP
jgi:predicted lipoprotein with Yx(FWY)xxD motif